MTTVSSMTATPAKIQSPFLEAACTPRPARVAASSYGGLVLAMRLFCRTASRRGAMGCLSSGHIELASQPPSRAEMGRFESRWLYGEHAGGFAHGQFFEVYEADGCAIAMRESRQAGA